MYEPETRAKNPSSQ